MGDRKRARGHTDRLLAAAVAAVCLMPFGCGPTGPTLYQALNNGEGYQDDLVAKDEYLVEFRANEKTTPAMTKNCMLYRCAELTREKGGQYFMVLGMTEAPYTPYTPYASYGTKTSLPGYVAQIRVFQAEPSPGGLGVYNAQQLIEMLNPQIMKKPNG